MKRDCDDCKYECGALCGRPSEIRCDKQSAWTPKEKEKVAEKLYTTGQMIDMLLENPERTASRANGSLKLFWDRVKESDNYHLHFDNGCCKAKVWIDFMDKGSMWTIIEPEPEKVSFVEALKAYKQGKTVRSEASGKRFNPNTEYLGEETTNVEIDGEWTILD